MIAADGLNDVYLKTLNQQSGYLAITIKQTTTEAEFNTARTHERDSL